MRCWAFGILVLGYVHSAHADAVKLENVIDVKEGQCIDKDSLVLQISTLLNRTEIDTHVHIDVTASEHEMETTFVVERSDAKVGERRIRSTRMSCPEFRSAVALAIAAAIDAEIATAQKQQQQQQQTPPSSNATTTAAIVVVPQPNPPIAEHPQERPKPPPIPHRVAVAGDGFFAGGLFTEAAAGFAPSFVFAFNSWLGARGGAVFATTTSGARYQGGTTTQSLAVATVSVCVLQDIPMMELRACPGVWLGQISASGTGFNLANVTTEDFYRAFSVRFDARFPRDSAFGVVLGFEPVVPLTKYNLVKVGWDPETRALPPVAVAGLIGVQVRIF